MSRKAGYINEVVFGALVGGLLATAGCATAETGPQEYRRHLAMLSAAMEEVDTCYEQAQNAAGAGELSKRLVLHEKASTVDPAKLAIDGYLTGREQDELEDLNRLSKPCHRLAVERYGAVHPEYARVFREKWKDELRIGKALTERQITIGQYNKELLEVRRAHGRRFGKLEQSIREQVRKGKGPPKLDAGSDPI
ncbi:MAG: hypothetical protein PVF91_11815 [Chromatiales bacterium]|jgi:hypothetical protein